MGKNKKYNSVLPPEMVLNKKEPRFTSREDWKREFDKMIREYGTRFDKKSLRERFDLSGPVLKRRSDAMLDSIDEVYRRYADLLPYLPDENALITALSRNEEYPLLMVEYSTAVPTDDHRMQRSDVYYWGAAFKVPVMKISPTDKGMGQKFGGGSRITDEQEQRLAHDHGALLYLIKWDTPIGQDVLPTKHNALSCIPYQQSIQDTVSTIVSTFSESGSAEEFIIRLQESYQHTYGRMLAGISRSLLRESIVNSTRFHWLGEKLSVKINRFGHAMDPDRGVLYYAKMLVGAANTITEIQVNRPDNPASRGGYKSLFDALSRENELLQYVEHIIAHQNNVFTDENALHILTRALNIDDAISFVLVRPHEYRIDSRILHSFLFTHQSIVAKTIFFLSTELRLTDKNRDIICTIKWDEAPGSEYLAQVYPNNRQPLRISPLTIMKAKEDIITFASVELYKKLHCDLVAVSYPGAQGDRCILTGAGRTVLRTYVDIIAYKQKNNEIHVFLEECKEQFSKSPSDVDKLNRLITEPDTRDGLKLLFRKTIGKDNITEFYTSVAAKQARALPRFVVDYIFMFNLSSDNDYTYIDYTVALVNTTLISTFRPLEDPHGKLTGRLKYHRIFIVD